MERKISFIVAWQPFRETVPYLYPSDIPAIPATLGHAEKIGDTVLPLYLSIWLE
jgi:hypothetical protein